MRVHDDNDNDVDGKTVMSDYNDGAQIVPLSGMAEMIAKAAPGIPFEYEASPGVPKYGRVQLLTRDDYAKLHFQYHDKSWFSYGERAPDFPLCVDYTTFAIMDNWKGAVLSGLAVRTAHIKVGYLRSDLPDGKNAHEIMGALTVDGKLIYIDPQVDDAWTDAPPACQQILGFEII